MTPTALAFLDTETDGLDPDRRIWDIAIIRREADGREKRFQAFIDIDISKANLRGLYVGHFYDRHPAGRLLSGLEAVMPDFPRVLTRRDAAVRIAQLTHGATIIGAVPNFDTEAISNLLRTHGIVPAWDHRLRCVETLAAGHLGREIGGLDACAAALGIPPLSEEDRHTAMGDALWARDIYDAIMTPTEPAL